MRFVVPFAVIAIFSFCAPKTIHAMGTLLVQSHTSIAPDSVPREETPGTGSDDVGMVMLRFINDTLIGSPVGSMSSITVELTGTVQAADIESIRVYYEGGGMNGLFDRGGGDDVDAMVGGPYSYDGGTVKTIDLDPDVVKFDNNDSVRLYVAYDFAAGADIGGDVGCEIRSVEWGPEGDGTGNTASEPDDWSLHGAVEDVDDYEVTLVATGIAPVPAEASQGSTRVGLLKLVFEAVDSSVTANIDSIRLHRVGTGSDSDIPTGGVILFNDSGTTPGSFDAGDVEVTAGSLSGGYVNLDPGSNLAVTSSGATYFVAINIDNSAQVGETIGLEVEDPSADIAFNDVETDPHVSVQYTQQGSITSSSAAPATANTVTILVLEDITPPTVSYTDPIPNERGILISEKIKAIFTEDIDPSTISSATYFLKDSFNNTIAGTFEISGTNVTFTPDDDLDYDTIYTATIVSGDSGVKDLVGNPLSSDYTWSFTTCQDVPKPVAANNRILPGSADPVKIYIPEPSGGPGKKITVQVFTVTGKRVATLVNKRPYSQIKDQIPLLWYGTNGQQQKLGPGLYFIQVVSGSQKTVLKVLIVR